MKKLNYKGIEKILVNSVLVLTGISALTPIIVLPVLSYAYLFPKITLFQILVELMVLCWILLMVLNKKYRPNFKNPVVIGAFIFILGLLISLPFGLDPIKSFWSVRIRMMGVITYLHLSIWFLILLSVIKKWRDWQKIIFVVTAVALIVDIVGLIQFAFIPKIPRITSTLGNSLYLSTYLLPITFLSFYAFYKVENNFWKYFYASAGALHLIVLILSASRGAFLALLVIGAIAFIYYLVTAKISKKRRVLISLGAIVILATMIFGGLILRTDNYKEWGRKNLPVFVRRVVYMDSVITRGKLWNIAWTAGKDYPVTGWGIENFSVAMNYYFSPSDRDKILRESWYDRAHNQFLDLFVATGIVGLTGYLLLWSFVFFTIFKIFKAKKDNKESILMIFFVFLGYLIQSFFLFDVASTTIFIYLILAILGFEYTLLKKNDYEDESYLLNNISDKFFVLLAISGAIIVGFFINYVNVLPMRQNLMGASANRYLAIDPEEALRRYKKAFAMNTYLNTEIYKSATDVMRPILENKDADSLSVLALTEFFTSVAEVEFEKRDYDYVISVASASVYLWDGKFNSDSLDIAEEIASKGIQISPNREENYEILGDIYMTKGDYEQAVKYFNIAREKSQENLSSFARVRLRLVEAYIALGDYDRAFAGLRLLSRDKIDIFSDVRIAKRLGTVVDKDINLYDAIWYIDLAWERNKTQPYVSEARIRLHDKAEEYITSNIALDQFAQTYSARAEKLRNELLEQYENKD